MLPRANGSAPFALDTNEGDGTITLAASGEFDLAAVPEFRRATRAAESCDRLVLDLHGLTFLDCGALHELASACRDWQHDGVGVSVVPPPPPAWRVIELTGMDRVLPLEQNGTAPS